MLRTNIVLNVKTKKQFLYTCSELSCNSMNNLSLYYGLTDARMRASEKDLPVSFFTQQGTKTLQEFSLYINKIVGTPIIKLPMAKFLKVVVYPK